MGSEWRSINGLTDGENAEVGYLLAQINRCRPRNLLRGAHYDSRQALSQVAPILPPMYQHLGLVLGWCAAAVDKLAARCAPEALEWPDGDKQTLNAFIEETDLFSSIKSAQTASLIHGPAFLINTQGVEGEPGSLIHARNALSTTGRWNRRTNRLDSLLSVVEWDDERKGLPSQFVLYLPNLTISARRTAGGWSIDQSVHTFGMPVEVLRYRPHSTTRDFGASRITRPMMSIQDAAIRGLGRLEGHLDVFGNPDYFILGADEKIFPTIRDRRQRWEAALGRIRVIPDDDDAPPGLERAQVQQFSATSPEPHLAALNVHAKLFAREASLSDSALALTDYSNPTAADAIEASLGELISLAEDAVDDWRQPERRAVLRGLAMREGLSSVPESWQVLIRHRDPRYISRSAAADAGVKQLSAAPDWLRETRVGMRLLGLTDDDIDAALAERSRAEGRANLAALAAVGRDADRRTA